MRVLAKADTAAAAQQASVSNLVHQLEQANTATRGVEAALGISEQRVADMQREITTLSNSANALERQRASLESRLQAAAILAESDRLTAAKEREALQTLLRQVEDRAYGEVDRVRQELKTLKRRS